MQSKVSLGGTIELDLEGTVVHVKIQTRALNVML